MASDDSGKAAHSSVLGAAAMTPGRAFAHGMWVALTGDLTRTRAIRRQVEEDLAKHQEWLDRARAALYEAGLTPPDGP
ncbi:MAG: hypothetical protein LBK42_10405 [Propionibacteriaceae bacterium]|jgi:hypothetical protein|nr:hypothetical protein [Propionibacteriaceae bacterium]